MKDITLKNLIIFLLIFSFLQSEDMHYSEHLKTIIWFENFSSFHHIAIPLSIGGIIGSLITIPKSSNIIRFNHDKYEYRVVYDE